MKMLYQLPPNTKELLIDLEKKINDMPQADRNAFVLDLIKFCLDWQFAYLAMKEQQNG